MVPHPEKPVPQEATYQLEQPQLLLWLCFWHLISVVVETGWQVFTLAPGPPEVASVRGVHRGERGPALCVLLGAGTGTRAEPPRGPSRPPAQQPGRDRRCIGGQSLLLSFLLSQTRLRSHTGMDTPFLPSSCGFFFFSWGVVCLPMKPLAAEIEIRLCG